MNIKDTQNRSDKKVKVIKTAKFSESSKRWLKRQLNDPYVSLAKQSGYRSRAAFKIIEIDNKYKIFKHNTNIIDLGAAPGGWAQIAVKKVAPGKVIAIDLLEIAPIEGVDFIQGDFMDISMEKLIIEKLNGQKAHGVISDMAANTIGHKSSDHLRIMALVETAFDFAKEILQEDGFFVAKVFSGGTEGEFLKMLKSYFKKTYHFKPDSSRKDSSEMYLVATGFKEVKNTKTLD